MMICIFFQSFCKAGAYKAGALPDDTLMIENERLGENERLFKMYKKSEEE